MFTGPKNGFIGISEELLNAGERPVSGLYSNVLYDYIMFDIFDYILGPVGRFAHLY